MRRFSVISRTGWMFSVFRASGGPIGGPPRLRYTAKLRRVSIFPRLIIRSSDIHAAGCFALELVSKGTRLLEYEGERITKDEGDVRYEGRPFTYLFGIGKGDIVIDG